MKDTVIKGDGTSRTLKAPASMPETFEEWRSQLLAGNATMDIGLNSDGCTVVGTAMSKANLLSDTTKAALELSQSDPTVNDALYALSQKGSPAEVHVMADVGTTVTMSRSGKTLTATVGSDGNAVLYPTELGEWTIVYIFDGSQKTRTYTLEVIGIVYVYPFVVGATLNDTTWENINMVSKLGMAKQFWSVGDTKTISVNGTNYEFQIIGFNHDDKTAGGKAGITFQMVDCLSTTYNMNSSNTNNGGWKNSAMRSRMSTFLSQLPSDLQSVIKAVNKLVSVGNNTSTIETVSDKLFLLSEVEIFGSTTYSFAGEGSQYDWYKAGNTKVKKVNGSAYYWWERSPRSGDTDYFCRVSSGGNANYNGASSSSGVSFGFCV